MPENPWPERPRLKISDGAGSYASASMENVGRCFTPRGSDWVARYHVARARPIVPETQLRLSGTFTLGVPRCGPVPAVRGARSAASAEPWSESSGPGPCRARHCGW
jgi:hypothetical protein